jgi:hypothetical protein
MNLTALPDGPAARDPQTVAYADRRSGQFAARGSVAQLRPAYARQGNSTTSVPMNRRATDAGRSAEPAADPDHLQADYFLRLLIPRCRQIDRKIDQHQKAIAIAETGGASDDAHRIRSMLRIDEQERQTLKALIDGLQQRFPIRSRG